MPIRVLITDDSAFFRKRMAEALLEDHEIELVGHARNGKEALEKVTPDLDVLTLDLQMPEMDGLTTIKELRSRQKSCKIIVVSAFTGSGVEMSLQALREGADDFLLKPLDGPEEFREFNRDLRQKIKALASRRNVALLKTNGPFSKRDEPEMKRNLADKLATNFINIVVIGASTGGPTAVTRILSDLPADFPVPVVVIQHMPPLFTSQFARNLSSSCRLRVLEAADGMFLEPGGVVLAPGGRNLGLRHFREAFICCLFEVAHDSILPHPSFSHLLTSLQDDAASVLAVMLTGIGSDGSVELAALNANGAITLSQDEASCVVYGMPRAAVEKGGVDQVVPLGNIGERITEYVARTRSGAPRQGHPSRRRI